jgi:hypothetical protein
VAIFAVRAAVGGISVSGTGLPARTVRVCPGTARPYHRPVESLELGVAVRIQPRHPVAGSLVGELGDLVFSGGVDTGDRLACLGRGCGQPLIRILVFTPIQSAPGAPVRTTR